MTEMDLEIQQLRRDNERLEKENESLKTVRQLDMGEIVRLRRIVGFHEEEAGKRAAELAAMTNKLNHADDQIAMLIEEVEALRKKLEHVCGGRF